MLLSRYRAAAVEGLTQVIQLRNSEGGERFLISTLIHRRQQDFTRGITFDVINQDNTQAFATVPQVK